MRFDRAVKLFNEALQLAKVIPGAESKWATTYLNLGQAYRKLGFARGSNAFMFNLLIIFSEPQNV